METYSPWSCVGAFFIPIVWLLYRKMYALLLIVCVAPIVFWWVGIELSGSAVGLAVAGSGKWFYLAKAKRAIRRVRASGVPDDERLKVLAKKGGVSNLGAFIGGLFTAGWILLMFLGAKHSV